jgi:S-adenosylmethionine decarboxylase
MSYHPGTHLIATLKSEAGIKLEEFTAFRTLINQLILDHQLQKLGEVYHNFEPSGYTGVVCLSESHLSIHTWPEHGTLNIDIYLSNHLRMNDGTVTAIYESICGFFGGTVEMEQILKR